MHFPCFGGHTSHISLSILYRCVSYMKALCSLPCSRPIAYTTYSPKYQNTSIPNPISHTPPGSNFQRQPISCSPVWLLKTMHRICSSRMNISNVCFFPVLVQMLGTLRKISSCNRKCLEDLTQGTLSSLVKFYEVLAFYFKTMISICYPSTPRHLHALSIMASLRTLSCCWMAPMVEPLVLYRNSCPKCTAWHPMWHLKRSKTWKNCLTAPAGVAALRTWDCTQSLGYFYLLLAVSLQLHCN